jgi:malonyl-CoA/methylmalonyl-CoA synthetase
LEAGGTMTFGVPTMYSRLADAIGEDRRLAEPFRRARMVISGSAALPTPVFERIRAATGQPIAERYGLTETMMNCAIRCWGDRRPGYVGPPLPGIDLRLVDDEGVEVTERDDETIGEIHVRGPNLFDGYLNRPDATDEAMSDGWFRTGDLATVSADGYVRIVGRRQTDLIKTGGYKVGAGEVENALLEHPAVAEVAVVGEPDDDLGQRIVAYVVPREGRPGASELVDHVAALLAPHKRPRDVRLVDSLPRNDMGKVRKTELTGPAGTDRRPSS